MMYFNTACLEEPPLSFKEPNAAWIISMYLGCAGGALGFVAFAFLGVVVAILLKLTNVFSGETELNDADREIPSFCWETRGRR